VLAAGCIPGEEASYSPEEDDAAIAAIASTWSASSPAISLSLCEDANAPEPDNTCQVEHVVRGGGRGRRHEERDLPVARRATPHRPPSGCDSHATSAARENRHALPSFLPGSCPASASSITTASSTWRNCAACSAFITSGGS
jgi:hypothetical protein